MTKKQGGLIGFLNFQLLLWLCLPSFVDKNHRMQATASTCYTRKQSTYLPQWDIIVEPFFKRDYKSKEFFFEVTDELKKNRKAFTEYAQHLLDVMWTS